MKTNNFFLMMLSLFLLSSCSNSGQKNTQNAGTTTDTNTVFVYYFHGKERCKTCNAVEKVAKETIEANYTNNNKVKLLVLPTDDKANEALVQKYEISWNGLLVVKGDHVINITEQAFADAVNQPDVLVELIKSEVNKRLN